MDSAKLNNSWSNPSSTDESSTAKKNYRSNSSLLLPLSLNDKTYTWPLFIERLNDPLRCLVTPAINNHRMAKIWEHRIASLKDFPSSPLYFQGGDSSHLQRVCQNDFFTRQNISASGVELKLAHARAWRPGANPIDTVRMDFGASQLRIELPVLLSVTFCFNNKTRSSVILSWKAPKCMRMVLKKVF